MVEYKSLADVVREIEEDEILEREAKSRVRRGNYKPANRDICDKSTTKAHHFIIVGDKQAGTCRWCGKIRVMGPVSDMIREGWMRN